MVVRLLPLPGRRRRPAADALACAACHPHGGRFLVAVREGGDTVGVRRSHG